MRPTDDPGETAGLLRDLLAEMRAIRAVVEGRDKAQLSRMDLDVLAVLLPAISSTFGDVEFRACEVLEDPMLRRFVPTMNTRRLGHLLQRAEGVDIAGVSCQRIGKEHRSILWRCKRR